MPKKIEERKIFVKRLEKGIEKPLRVVFESNIGEHFESPNIGEYFIETEKENFDLFFPGKEYNGIFKISGIPDFIGQADEWENVCTMSYSLEKIIGNEKFVKDGEVYSKVIGNCIGKLEGN